MDLKIACGSWYHPKPSMEFPSGQDCHFHSAHRKIFGVADGVGGYRVRGIDSGIYARELMCNAVDAIAELFKLPCRKHNNIENIPLEVMKKAFDKTTALGASTACIISLVGQACSCSLLYMFHTLSINILFRLQFDSKIDE